MGDLAIVYNLRFLVKIDQHLNLTWGTVITQVQHGKPNKILTNCMQNMKSFENEKTYVLILLLYLWILLAGKLNPLSNKTLGVANIFQAEIEKKIRIILTFLS